MEDIFAALVAISLMITLLLLFFYMLTDIKELKHMCLSSSVILIVGFIGLTGVDEGENSNEHNASCQTESLHQLPSK